MENINQANLEYLRTIVGSKRVDFFIETEKNGFKNMSRLKYLTCEEIRSYLRVMESYGENKWWLSNNPIVRAYYQLCCPIQLILFNTAFQKAVEQLLGHSVLDVTGMDFRINYIQLYAKEANEAFKKFHIL